MSYRIEYQPLKKVRGLEKRMARGPAVAALCLLLVLFWTLSMWPRVGQVIYGLILPDGAVTAGALEAFAEDLGAGESVGEAFRGFCQQVMGLGPA